MTLEYCPNCGTKLGTDAAYCHVCGTSVKSFEQPIYRRERHVRKREANEAIWSPISFVGFLIIVGLTFLAYPDLLGRIWSYFHELITLGRLVLPPARLGEPLIYFLNLSGAWGLFFGVVAAALGRSLRRAFSDIIGAFYAFYLASIFTEFYAGMIHGTALVFSAILGLIVVIVANIVVWAALLAYRSAYPRYAEAIETPGPKV
ncbi:MAG: zinc-ribbon domain-containing protein [Nitrososphaerota archaeon]|nr:zinc-ribbon domain-containing protein [Nitrososphaerota archaeon]